jgi:uncharacterized protein
MEMDEKGLIEHLKLTNPEFRQLMEEHQQYEQQLEAFNKLRYLTSEQEVDKKRVQKLKLHGKDRMAAILTDYKSRLSQQLE